MLRSVAQCADPRRILAILALTLAGHAVAHADERGAVTDERDAVIEELRRRIELLEKRLDDKPPPPPPPPSVVPAPAVPGPAPKPAASEEKGRDDESARALERTLVREGGLVLPPRAVEIEPRLQYTYRSVGGLRIVSQGGQTQIAEQDVKRDETEASLGFRVGLPHAFQFELRIPYVSLRQEQAIAGAQSESDHTTGPGDLELGLVKQLSRERGSRPSVLASVNWRAATGRHQLGELSPGGGFHQWQAALTTVKRQDPLVLFGTLSYTAVLERTRDGVRVDPGDAVGLKFGSLLAASPETSLRGAIELSRSRSTKVDGQSVPGSETTIGMLELGLATLLSPRALVDFQVGIGLTRDAPDFRLRVSLPMRF